MRDSDFTHDEKLIADAVREARHIQEFIWDNESLSRQPFGPASWSAVFQKRVDAINAIDPSKRGAMVELRKRLLQQAALSIKALVVLRTYGIAGDYALDNCLKCSATLTAADKERGACTQCGERINHD